MENGLMLEENVVGGRFESLSQIYRRILLAWAVLMTVFTLIPGLVALRSCLSIRGDMSAEEQNRRADTAFDWCMVGTLLIAIVLFLTRAR